MALRFFRRHQKMVIIIMAVLMVSFLIGFQGFQSIVARRTGGAVVGTLGDGTKVTQRDVLSAADDMRILDQTRITWIPEYVSLRVANKGGEGKAEYAYALLLKEAKRAGVEVTDDGVDVFISRLGLTDQSYEQMVSHLLARLKVPEKRVRQAIARWLLVYRWSLSARVEVPPSEAELRRLYRDLSEKMNLLVARIPGEKFIEDMREPSKQEIEKQFRDFAEILPDDRYPTIDSFGFSYYVPDYVSIVYLLIREGPIERVVDVSSVEALKYYEEHKDEFIRREPIPSTQPTTAPDATTAPTETQPVEYRTVQMEYPEVKPRILAMLKRRELDRVMEALLRRAETLRDRFEMDSEDQPSAGTEKNYSRPYEHVRAKMVLPADRVLGKRMDVSIDKESLRDAIRKLEDAAKVRICYPWGKHGDLKVDPDLRVKLVRKGITLAEALEEITRQLELPKVQWAECDGVRNAIFPISGIEFFPVSLGMKKKLDREALREDEILGASFTEVREGHPSGESLWELIFLTEEFGESKNGFRPAAKEGWDGPRMYLLGEQDSGRVVWRLTEVVSGHKPTERTPEIDERIKRDLKGVAAFKVASDRAERIKADAENLGLEVAAKKADVEAVETGLLARKVIVSPQRQIFAYYIYSGMKREQAEFLAAAEKPIDILATYVPTLFPHRVFRENEHLREQLLDLVFDPKFELTPEDVEPPYPDKPFPVKVLKLPASLDVLVVQRMGYKPAVQGEYDKGRLELQTAMLDLRRWEVVHDWFGFDKIKDRLGYKWAER